LVNGTYTDNKPVYPATYAQLDESNTYPFHFLLGNNAFGNNARFTDLNGNYYTNPFDNTTGTNPTMYADGVMIDHLSGDAYAITAQPAATWATAISTTNALVFAGISDWRVCHPGEYWNILCLQTQALFPGSRLSGLEYYPIDQGNNEEFWTSGTVVNDPNVAYTYFNGPTTDLGININREIKINALRYYIVTRFYS
jgi:hypothetical protein